MFEMYDCKCHGILLGDGRSEGSVALDIAEYFLVAVRVDFRLCCISTWGREMFCITPCIVWGKRSRDTTLEWSAVTKLLLFDIRLLPVDSRQSWGKHYLCMSLSLHSMLGCRPHGSGVRQSTRPILNSTQ